MYLDAAPGSFLGKNCVKAVCTCILSSRGNTKACGTARPGPPRPHGTQSINLVFWVERDLRPGPGFPDSSPTPAITQILIYLIGAEELSQHNPGIGSLTINSASYSEPRPLFSQAP